MPVELRDAQRRKRLDVAKLKKDAEKLLTQAGRADSVLSILLTDDELMAELHELWMKEKGPTDVMSFPQKGDGPLGDTLLLGDVVISVETAARRKPKAVYQETLRYLVHGLLHLIGFDHRTRQQKVRMDTKAKVLTLGIQ